MDDFVSTKSPEIFEHRGVDYTVVLSWIHSYLRPKTYLEIGTRNGASARLASCDSIFIDPKFELSEDSIRDRGVSIFMQKTSDDFFATFRPADILGRPIEFAFLDGLHEFETLLRDFINLEKSCRGNSIFAIHDCYPPNLRMASRAELVGEAWTGDVWKLVPVLKKERPDLKLLELNAAPTGLLMCTGFNPKSVHLEENYQRIIEEWRDIELEAFGHETLLSNLRPTGIVETAEKIRKFYWL